MSKLSASSRYLSSGLFALLAVGAASAAATGCAKADEEKKTANWTCTRDEVPMGEVVRCSTSALTADGPSTASVTGSTGTTSSGGTTDGTTPTGGVLLPDPTAPLPTAYNCSGQYVAVDCPPIGATGGDGTDPVGTGSGSTSGGTTDGTTNSGGTSGTGTSGTTGTSGGGTSGGSADGTSGSTPVGTASGTSSSSSGGTGNGNGGTNGNGSTNGNASSSGGGGNSSGNSGHTNDGTGPNGSNSNGTTNGGGGSSHERGPDECSWVPDLDYCSGSGGGTSDGSTSDGTTMTGTSSSSSGGTSGGSSGATSSSSSGGTSGATSSSSSGGTSGATSSSSSGGTGTDCTKSNCDVPGQTKKGGTTDGTSSSSSSGGASSSSSGGASSSSSGGSGSGGGGKSWDCTKDDKGNRICVSTPECAPGTHAAACGACVDDSDTSGGDCVPPTEGGCWITGGGFIEGASIVPAAPADGKDNFGGNAKPMKKGGVSGHWNHVDHGTGNHAKGRPEYIMCRVTDGPGPKQPGGKKGLVVNQVYFGGHAQWREAASATWADGYWFDVVAEDHGEPGNTSAIKNGAMPDSYHFTIRKMDDPTAKVSGAIVYETRDDLRGGNIQIHPSNPGHPAVSDPLPSWVSIEQ